MHGWTDIPNVPNLDAPALPECRLNGQPWPAFAKRTWSIWSSMPHTVRWSDADWLFAEDCLELVVRCAAENSAVALWTESRNRQRIMGTTMDARMGLRIRYVPATDPAAAVDGVASLDDYRQL
ncbi:hypothetical protein A5731_22740 [Mycolicibacterium conceptionense]|uniref:Uncharacterized protein n=1 Tax=Mycolicibacterium conceptionense TaxID=451644 RepID=A0A1A1YH39_9MYCO|nr:hypothetical protein A5718_07800 [Mycolicibacterium conceptionense]OBE98515.1 hypothetical protein A5731_22740 [Mycolicibacterium conceptionense]OBF15046.1 hypothetical protein A5726_22980 [Mycolicibacterium conceptionense]OBF30621.1 hypothetical protein A5720_29705 [Mycolicibacterium conceptionense]OBH94968.1 hypothetical protein A5716_23405 [Mycolicibacterium conceptionense]